MVIIVNLMKKALLSLIGALSLLVPILITGCEMSSEEKTEQQHEHHEGDHHGDDH